MTWEEVLKWIFGGPGAAIIVYAALEEWGQNLPAIYKRYIAVLGTPLLVAGGYAAAVWWGYVENPGPWKAWVAAVAPLGITALGLNQIIHGEKQIRPKRLK